MNHHVDCPNADCDGGRVKTFHMPATRLSPAEDVTEACDECDGAGEVLQCLNCEAINDTVGVVTVTWSDGSRDEPRCAECAPDAA